MARFDVYRNTGKHASDIPYLLDVQSALLDGLETRVVVPLRRRDRFPACVVPARLTPVFLVEDMECLMETPKLAAVPVRMLNTPVLSLADAQAAVTGALAFLFQGY